ncbi:MAG: xanthine dehydrogenase family protein subunit M [Anaerolineales bacterium]|nr:xanthine dehydrogenase family protein subunit M [Anaerolineales bacterium]
MTLPMPGLPSFDYVRAETPAEVVELLRKKGKETRLLMGGTDIFMQMRGRELSPAVLLDVKALPGMNSIDFDSQSGLRVGAAVTMNALAKYEAVRAHYPMLEIAANTVASYPLRNRATIGGNLCNASPAADLAPPSLVLEASMIAHGPKGERSIPATAFFRGPGEHVLDKDEFLISIVYPVPPARWQGSYHKLGRNKHGDLAVVSVAVMAYPEQSATSGYLFRLALGSVAPTPIRALEAEAILAKGPLDEQMFEQAAEAAKAVSAPIDDVRASAGYRKAMVKALTLRGIREVWSMMEKEG